MSPKELGDVATQRLSAIGKRYEGAGFPAPWTFKLDEEALLGVAEDLARLGLIAHYEGDPAYSLTADARTWILEDLGKVVVFCPKCSGDEYVPKGDRTACASCRICGVGWTEDTTVEPFVPRY